MKTAGHIAKHFRDLHFGKNWTASDYKEVLKDITWEESTKKIQNLNTIATLVNHVHYYLKITAPVFDGKPLVGNDKESWKYDFINSHEEWELLLDSFLKDAKQFAMLIEGLPEDDVWSDFDNGKYGNYYRNIQGIVEHAHYHLGQIVIIKKLLRNV